jgi:hypothetical protein
LYGTAYKVSDYPEPHVEVWNEHWDVINLFTLYSTQWRTGMNGPTGLDFNVIHHALDRKGIEGEMFDQFVSDLRVIERAALVELHRGN